MKKTKFMLRMFSATPEDQAEVSSKIEEAKENGTSEMGDITFAEKDGDIIALDPENDEATVITETDDEFKMEPAELEDDEEGEDPIETVKAMADVAIAEGDVEGGEALVEELEDKLEEVKAMCRKYSKTGKSKKFSSDISDNMKRLIDSNDAKIKKSFPNMKRVSYSSLKDGDVIYMDGMSQDPMFGDNEMGSILIEVKSLDEADGTGKVIKVIESGEFDLGSEVFLNGEEEFIKVGDKSKKFSSPKIDVNSSNYTNFGFDVMDGGKKVVVTGEGHKGTVLTGEDAKDFIDAYWSAKSSGSKKFSVTSVTSKEELLSNKDKYKYIFEGPVNIKSKKILASDMDGVLFIASDNRAGDIIVLTNDKAKLTSILGPFYAPDIKLVSSKSFSDNDFMKKAKVLMDKRDSELKKTYPDLKRVPYSELKVGDTLYVDGLITDPMFGDSGMDQLLVKVDKVGGDEGEGTVLKVLKEIDGEWPVGTNMFLSGEDDYVVVGDKSKKFSARDESTIDADLEYIKNAYYHLNPKVEEDEVLITNLIDSIKKLYLLPGDEAEFMKKVGKLLPKLQNYKFSSTEGSKQLKAAELKQMLKDKTIPKFCAVLSSLNEDHMSKLAAAKASLPGFHYNRPGMSPMPPMTYVFFDDQDAFESLPGDSNSVGSSTRIKTSWFSSPETKSCCTVGEVIEGKGTIEYVNGEDGAVVDGKYYPMSDLYPETKTNSDDEDPMNTEDQGLANKQEEESKTFSRKSEGESRKSSIEALMNQQSSK